MRVLRTVTIENSAATKNPLAKTRARTPARRHRTPATDSSIGYPQQVTVAKTATKTRKRDSAAAARHSGAKHASLRSEGLAVFVFSWLRFAVRKEVRVDEVVDDRLIGGIDRF